MRVQYRDAFVSQNAQLAVYVKRLLESRSGSVEWEPGGFNAEKSFTKHLFDLLEFGEDKAKAGVVLFSWEAELIADMSTDRDTLKSAVDAMNWPGWNTDTAAGLFSGFF